jgi:hypothetical protein
MWAALGCLENGNPDEAAELLREALTPRRLPPACHVCGVRAWPGDHSKHIYSIHNPGWERAA